MRTERRKAAQQERRWGRDSWDVIRCRLESPDDTCRPPFFFFLWKKLTLSLFSRHTTEFFSSYFLSFRSPPPYVRMYARPSSPLSCIHYTGRRVDDDDFGLRKSRLPAIDDLPPSPLSPLLVKEGGEWISCVATVRGREGTSCNTYRECEREEAQARRILFPSPVWGTCVFKMTALLSFPFSLPHLSPLIHVYVYFLKVKTQHANSSHIWRFLPSCSFLHKESIFQLLISKCSVFRWGTTRTWSMNARENWTGKQIFRFPNQTGENGREEDTKMDVRERERHSLIQIRTREKTHHHHVIIDTTRGERARTVRFPLSRLMWLCVCDASLSVSVINDLSSFDFSIPVVSHRDTHSHY